MTHKNSYYNTLETVTTNVAQFYVNPPQTTGGSSPAIWWALFALSVMLFFFAPATGIFELGMIACCSGFFTGIVALSLSFNGGRKTVIVQTIPQIAVGPIAPQMYAQQSPQTQVRQRPASRVISAPPNKPPAPDMANSVAKQAKNLELARDFEGAAKLYQKAGLFGEAGRIRKEYLEKDESPMVQIGHVGDSIVRDSVVMNEPNSTELCKNCGTQIQPDWKFCPGCNSPIS